MADIPITGVPSSYRVPGSYVEILFAQGPATAAVGVREVAIVAPKLSSASAVAGTLYKIGNEQDIIDVAGTGSPAHRACRMALLANKDMKLTYVGMEPTTGGTPVAATATVTYATTATGTGSTIVTIAGEECSAAITSGDDVTTIGDNVEAVINAKTWLPVTASNAAGVVTLTAKIAGTSQGDGTIPVIRLRAEISTGITTTVATSGAYIGSAVAGAEGSTAEAAQLATALAALANIRKYYIGVTTHDDTGLGNLETHLSTKSEPRPGLRSVGVAGYNGTLASAQTLANNRNYERIQLAWQPNSEHDPAELVGNMLGIRQKREGTDAAYNFDSYRASDWLIKPAYAAADFPGTSDQNDAINDGITVIASDNSGSYIVMSTTTRSKNAAGTVDDFRAGETHRISVADFCVDEMLSIYAQRYTNFKLKDDQLLADGTVNTNQTLQNGVTTASTFKPWIRERLDNWELRALTQNAESSKESLRVVRDPTNSGRLEVGYDLQAIDHLHQATFRVAETSTG
jgi:phage tail sheath gpL-like